MANHQWLIIPTDTGPLVWESAFDWCSVVSADTSPTMYVMMGAPIFRQRTLNFAQVLTSSSAFCSPQTWKHEGGSKVGRLIKSVGIPYAQKCGILHCSLHEMCLPWLRGPPVIFTTPSKPKYPTPDSTGLVDHHWQLDFPGRELGMVHPPLMW